MATENGIPVEKSLENQQVICICGLCKKTFDTSIKLRMHLFSHFPEFQSKCVYCQQNFSCRKNMVIHMETLHHMTLENVVDYLEKLRLKHNEHEMKEGGPNELDKDSLQYSCNICGKQYSSRKDLIQHMRQMHPLTKVFADPWSSKLYFHGNVRYKCDLCSVSFHRKSSLKHHIMLSHTADGNPDTVHKPVNTTEGNEFGRMSTADGKLDTVHKTAEGNELCHAKNEICDEKVEGKQYPDCDIGHKDFTNSWTSEKRLNLHGNSRCSCKACSKSFSYKQILQTQQTLEHAAIKHDDTAFKNEEIILGIAHDNVKENKYSEQVGTEFEEDHLDVFPTKVKDFYSCFHCNKTFNNKKTLDKHIRWHFGFKLYTCQICRTTLSNALCLKRHTRIHLGDSVYTCNKCGESFPFHKVLKEHIIYEHGEKTVTCKFCRKVFTEEALKEHMKMHRIEDNKCKICGTSFRRRGLLERHMASHSDKRPHKCYLCNKTYKSYKSLQDHISGHKRNLKQCEVCGKSVSSDILRQHMIKHSDVKIFQCEVCSKFFKMKHQLKSHLLTHYEVRKHECEICGFKFKWAHHLRSHRKAVHKT